MKSFSDMQVTLRDLYETRMIFEPEAAALACRRATDEEIAHILRLGQECQRHLEENPTGKERIESESDFHGAILKASHNEFISRFMPMLTETIEKTFALDFNLDVIAEDAYKDQKCCDDPSASCIPDRAAELAVMPAVGYSSHSSIYWYGSCSFIK